MKEAREVRDISQVVRSALHRNVRPGIVLWVLLVVFTIAYTIFSGFKEGLGQIGEFKMRYGYLFSFTAFFIAGAILPELLKIILFQKMKFTRGNMNNILLTGIVFGMAGIWSDFFFVMQSEWFGTYNDIGTILKKMVNDQFLFSPIFNMIMLSVLYWRENGFPLKRSKEFSPRWYAREKLLPVVVSTWLVWIPGTMVIYFMPLALQLPVTCLIMCFFSLIVTFLSSARVEVQHSIG